MFERILKNVLILAVIAAVVIPAAHMMTAPKRVRFTPGVPRVKMFGTSS